MYLTFNLFLFNTMKSLSYALHENKKLDEIYVTEIITPIDTAINYYVSIEN